MAITGVDSMVVSLMLSNDIKNILTQNITDFKSFQEIIIHSIWNYPNPSTGLRAIFRYFGLGPALEIEVVHETLEDLDRVVLLTDGVTKAYHPLEAGEIIKGYPDIAQAARALAQRSRTKGSSDDITVMVIEVEEV